MSDEIKIYGPIGDPDEGITSKQFMESLEEMPTEAFTVRINTNGGSVSEGIAIGNAMRKHPAHVTTIVEGGAYSIGGYIACCGDKRIIEPNSALHIHGPQLRTDGNLEDHEDSIEELRIATKTMSQHYAKITGKKPKHFVEQFHRDKFYDAEESVALGFMTDIGESKTAFAMHGFREIDNIPKKFAAAWHASEGTKEPETRTMAKATIKEMKAKFRGASAEFLVSQDEADATIESATAAYISELESSNKTLTSANADLRKQMEAMDDDEETNAETPEETIARLEKKIEAMENEEAEAFDEDDEETEAFDDEETEADCDDDDDDAQAMEDDEEITALKAEIEALKAGKAKARKKSKAKAKKKNRGPKRRGARAVRTSSRSRGPSRKSATAVVDARVKAKMAEDKNLSRREAAQAVYKDDPALRERMIEEANDE